MAGALTQGHMQAEAGDGPPEPPLELKPRDTRRISLRFRKRRKESTERAEPAAVGTMAPFLYSHPRPDRVPPGAAAPAAFPAHPVGQVMKPRPALWSSPLVHKVGRSSLLGGGLGVVGSLSWAPRAVPPSSRQQRLLPTEGVAASGNEQWSRPRERVRALGLQLQSCCLAL